MHNELLIMFLPEWLTGFNFLLALFGFLCLIGATILVLTLRGKTEVGVLQLDRANAAEGLVKLRDIEKEALSKKLAESESELEDVTAEHRALVGVIISELLAHWENKTEIEAKILRMEREIKILRKAHEEDK